MEQEQWLRKGSCLSVCPFLTTADDKSYQRRISKVTVISHSDIPLTHCPSYQQYGKAESAAISLGYIIYL